MNITVWHDLLKKNHIQYAESVAVNAVSAEDGLYNNVWQNSIEHRVEKKPKEKK